MVTAIASGAVSVLIDSYGKLGTISSSRRFKEDIHDMGEASSRLFQLQPVTFRYKKEHAPGNRRLQYGLIAEEVAEVYPELVQYGSDGEPNTVLYHLLPSMLLNEVQKQQRQFQELLHELQEHQRQIQEQADLIAQLTASLAELEAQKAESEVEPAKER